MLADAMAIANDNRYTEQERRDMLAKKYAHGEIDQNAYDEALAAVSFQYKPEQTAILKYVTARVLTPILCAVSRPLSIAL